MRRQNLVPGDTFFSHLFRPSLNDGGIRFAVIFRNKLGEVGISFFGGEIGFRIAGHGDFLGGCLHLRRSNLFLISGFVHGCSFRGISL